MVGAPRLRREAIFLACGHHMLFESIIFSILGNTPNQACPKYEHGIHESITWHAKMSQMPFSRIQGRLARIDLLR